MSDKQFAWACILCVSALIVLLVILGARRRVVEPEAEQRARDFVLSDHPDWTDPEPMTDADVCGMWANVLDGTPLPEPTVACIEVNSGDVWEWMREEWKRDGAAGTTVVIDGAMAPHTVRYVYDDDSTREWDVTARVNAWLLRRAEITEVGPVEPEVRYWVTRPSLGWHEHEVTRREYVYLEHEFGFRTVEGRDPVTRWFCEPYVISAWTTRDGNRGDAPTSFGRPRDCRAAWVDPDGELTASVEHAAPYDHLVRLSDNVDRHLGIDRDLPQWADTADRGPRTVSPWDQPAKRINGSAL